MAKRAGDHFQIASGTQQSKTDNGDKISIVRFRNGDQMIVNKTDSETLRTGASGNFES